MNFLPWDHIINAQFSSCRAILKAVGTLMTVFQMVEVGSRDGYLKNILNPGSTCSLLHDAMLYKQLWPQAT